MQTNSEPYAQGVCYSLSLTMRKFYSVFSTSFLMYFSCGLLLVMGFCCLFLILKYFGDIKPMKCNPNKSSMQIEDKQDQSMKGCSHKELDEETYQQ